TALCSGSLGLLPCRGLLGRLVGFGLGGGLGSGSHSVTFHSCEALSVLAAIVWAVSRVPNLGPHGFLDSTKTHVKSCGAARLETASPLELERVLEAIIARFDWTSCHYGVCLFEPIQPTGGPQLFPLPRA